MGDFLLKGDAAFNDGFKNLCQYVGVKTGGEPPEWNHIPDEEVEALNAAYAEWLTVYTPCLKPHTSVETNAKNTVRKAKEKQIRLFKHRNLDFRPEVVTEGDFIAMGFSVRDTTPTFQGVPEVRASVLVENTRNRYENKVLAINPETGNSRKPKGVHGVCFASQVGGERPVSGEAMADKKFSVSPDRIYTYSAEQKGLPVYYSVCYENRKGNRGPWSDVEQAFIG